MAKVVKQPVTEPGAPVLVDLKVSVSGEDREVAIVANPTGSHFLKVGRLMNGDPEQYYPATMHVLLRVQNPEGSDKPWRQLAPQQWIDLPWKNFQETMAKLVELGFQLGG